MAKGIMKHKKILICLLAVGAVMIVSIIIGLLINQGLSDDNIGEGPAPTNTPAPEDYSISTVQDALTGIVERKQLIYELASRDEDTPTYLKEIESRSSYRVLSIESGESVYAVVQVTAPDLYTTVHQLEMTDGMTEKEMDQALTQALADAPMIETEVTLMCSYDEGWTPVLNQEFYDAYYGGVLRLRTEYFEQILEGLKDGD